MIENGTVLQDRYLIEKQIGAGGMGAVYLAVDQRFGNHVAIKETFYKDEEFGAAFEREAKLLNGLNHPALPHVSDYFTEGGENFLVMQYIEGEDLPEILKRDGAFPVETVLRWADSLLDALDYLHSQNPPIIHRDIKPQNLKVNTRGEVVLLDFGLAKLKSEDSTAAAHSVFGYSRKYSSLEQIQGVGTDARSDIFSLAATLYHLLAGAAPTDVLARAASIVAGKNDPLPSANDLNENVPAGVAEILDHALALNSAERFSSAQEMREALRNSVAGNEAAAEKAGAVSAVAAVGGASANGFSEAGINTAQDFPALAAFAEEVKNNTSPGSHSQTESFAPVSATDDISLDKGVREPYFSNALTEAPTAVARPRKSAFPLAAVALVLLICAGLTAGYFINKSAASAETPADESRVQSFPKPETVADDATASDALPVNTAVNETQPIAAETENVAEENAASKEEKTYKPKPATAAVAAKNQPVKNTAASAPRRESPGNGETRERVIDSEPLPDIESIFTGRPSAARRNQSRNRRQNEMSDEEVRELRRQRRQERRRRQNRDPLPF